jgi:deoxyribose-phosphate aldolase
MQLTAGQLASYIDHTALKPDTTRTQIETLCQEARHYNFAAVCVNPVWVRYSATNLADTSVAVAAVVGFPLGANTSAIKAQEAEQALADGASEVDMVLNIGALKGGDLDAVRDDIAAVTEVTRAGHAICKVIIETALLTDEEKRTACRLAQEAGADYVKTSTGFGPGGATVDDVALMREVVGPDMGIKAAGGIRTAEDARLMIEAGATRLGASSGVQIVEGAAADADTSDY